MHIIDLVPFNALCSTVQNTTSTVCLIHCIIYDADWGPSSQEDNKEVKQADRIDTRGIV